MWRRSAISFAAGLAYIFWPRRGDLRGFNPKAVARLETAIWRHYYQHDYSKLFRALYSLNREVYHFSPWDSVRPSYYAARAARSFQSTRSRTAAKGSIRRSSRDWNCIGGNCGGKTQVRLSTVKSLRKSRKSSMASEIIR